jgi:hypothetical protein
MTIRTYAAKSGPLVSTSVTISEQAGFANVRWEPDVRERITKPASSRTRRKSSNVRVLAFACRSWMASPQLRDVRGVQYYG